MASVGEANPQVSATSPTDQRIQAEYTALPPNPESISITGRAWEPASNAAIAASSARVRSLLLKVWRARGFFGGLVAIGLAFAGQKTLIEQSNPEAATRYYVAAFAILILTLLHPTFPSLPFRRKGKVTADSSTALSVISDVPSVTEFDGSNDNGSSAANIGHDAAQTNGPNPAVQSDTVPTTLVTDNWQEFLPLPVRKAGSRVHESVATEPVAVDSESSPVALPTQPLRSRRSTVTAPVELMPAMAPDVAPVEVVSVPEHNGNGHGNGREAVPARRLFAFPSTISIPRLKLSTLVSAELGVKKSIWARWVGLRAALGWRLTLPLFLLAAGVGVASFLKLQASIGDVTGGWLWFASMVLLVFAFAGAPRWPRALSGLLVGPDDGFFGTGVPQAERPISSTATRGRSNFFTNIYSFLVTHIEVILVVALFAVALALRLWNLEYFPGIFGDEGERGTDARAIMQGRPDLIFGTGWWAVPNLYFYWIAWMLRIFGDNMVGDRMPSVIASLVTIWAVYRTGRLLWGPRAGLLAGALLAVSPLWLQFSREAGESTPTVMCWALGFLFLFRALRFRNWVDWALSGLAFGFSLYFYAAGKMVVPMVAAIAVYLLIRWRWEFIKRYAIGFGLLLLGFGLAPMPYLLFLSANHFTDFFSRANETSIFTPGHAADTFGKYGVHYDNAWAGLSIVQNLLQHPAAWGVVIFNQARIAVDVLYRVGDSAFFYTIHDHNGTLLTPVLACLTLLGLVYFAWKFWDGRYALPMIWFWAGLGGIIFTIDAPNVQRLVGAWPVVFLFPAVMIDRVLASAWPLNITFARRWLSVPVVGLVIFATVEGYHEYFVIYNSQCSFCTATVQARYAQALGQDYKGYQMGVAPYDTYFTYGSTRFAAKDVEGEDLNVPMDVFPVTDNNHKGLAFMVYPSNAQYLPIINLMYPGGLQEDIKGNDDSLQFTSYKITREQAASFQTSYAEYHDADGSVARRFEPDLGTSRSPGQSQWTPPPGASFPMTATWQGGLVAPDYGQYTFSLSGGLNDHFVLDGNAVLDGSGTGKHTVTLVLAKGLHEVQLTGNMTDAQTPVTLQWAGGVGTPMPIAPNFLYNGITGGLTGMISYNNIPQLDVADPFANHPADTIQIDPFLSIRDAGAATASFQGRPFFARWQGTISIDVTGQYGFLFQSNGATMLKIDDQMVLDSAKPAGTSNPIMLTKGLHNVDVRYIWQGQQGGSFEWFWTPPGGQQAIVPPTVLRPLARSWKQGEIPTPNIVPNVAPPPPASVGIDATAILGGDAGLSLARGVGVDAKGNIYIGDNGNHRIVVLDSGGNTVATWGSETKDSAQGKINLLGDIWTTPDGHTYTLDSNDGDVQVFNPDGSVGHYFKGLAVASGGITVGPDGNIYIANTINSQVLVVGPDGGVLKKFRGGADGTPNHFEQPIDVTLGPDGTVYVVDMRNRISQLDADGNIVREWPVQVGIGQGGSHLIYWKNSLVMTNPDQQKLAIINLATGEMRFVGTDGNGSSQMHLPIGLAVGPQDNLYVMDSGNNRVLVFSNLDAK